MSECCNHDCNQGLDCPRRKAPQPAQESQNIKLSRAAQSMYSQHPTYKGTKPMTWYEAPLAVKREWIQKARAAHGINEEE